MKPLSFIVKNSSGVSGGSKWTARYVEEHDLFEPGGISFLSYPEGGGSVRVSREKLEGFSPTEYTLYLSLSAILTASLKKLGVAIKKYGRDK